MGTIKDWLKNAFYLKIDIIPPEEIDTPTTWIQKPGVKDMRYLEVYEDNLDIFLADGWEVWHE